MKMKNEEILKSLVVKKAYNSDSDNILQDFYIPALSRAKKYYRLAGYFSSTSLAIAAKGIGALLKNNGKMNLVVCPKLSKKDIETITKADSEPNFFIEKKLLTELESFENECIRDHVYMLGWMIANDKLEMKVALMRYHNIDYSNYEEVENIGIFHQKVGILEDYLGNVISFSGSINESAKGWLGNVEEFKVFRSWVVGEKDYVEEDRKKFQLIWEGCAKRLRTIELPIAVKEKLLEIAPKDLSNINLEKWHTKKKNKINLYNYQEEAVTSWIENKYRGIFEMATGTGKTFTALGCVQEIINKFKKNLIVITCPYGHLIQQWKREIAKFGLETENTIIADSTNPAWKKMLPDSLIDLSLDYIDEIFILTTHSTFSSKDFVRIIKDNKEDSSAMLIADEVHGLGAKKRITGLIEEYDKRLGLSATPKRWFDDIGTKNVFEYFNNVVYEFGLEKAINTERPGTNKTYLTPYRYVPKFVSLTHDELDEYINTTRAIIMSMQKDKSDKETNRYFENLLFKRAEIIKSAENKYNALDEILKELESPIKWTLIYCSHNQIDEVMKILNSQNITSHRFTMDEGAKQKERFGGISERDFILKKFSETKYQTLVAMKCLDEGIDVPPARQAILMSSSGNPREYIQRIGRVIRRHGSKKEAIIYDIIVIPTFDDMPQELEKLEWKIFNKELNRVMEIAGIAKNSTQAIERIFSIKKRYLESR